MESKRDIYAVTFVKLVDSTHEPIISGAEFSGATLKIKTSNLKLPDVYQRVRTEKFATKTEFVTSMLKRAMQEWDDYESEKLFFAEELAIIDDIDKNIPPENVPKDDDDYVRPTIDEIKAITKRDGSWRSPERVLADMLDDRPDITDNGGVFRRANIRRKTCQ